MTLACGIDFGTSNSAVGTVTGGQGRLLPLQNGSTSVPTALFFSFEDESRSHGREAMRRYLTPIDDNLTAKGWRVSNRSASVSPLASTERRSREVATSNTIKTLQNTVSSTERASR